MNQSPTFDAEPKPVKQAEDVAGALGNRIQPAPAAPVEGARPKVSVGVRFHDPDQAPLLERCLVSIGAQSDVEVTVLLALQGFDAPEVRAVRAICNRALRGTGVGYQLIDVPNPEGQDLRARLLNQIVQAHFESGDRPFLAFIDYDDIWFQHALATLAEPLRVAKFAMSYADVHCADVYYDDGQVYLRDVRDHFGIGEKTKQDLRRGNFLPLHSYMFDTRQVGPEVLRFDEELARLEDYDVLLAVASAFPVTGYRRKHLIGFYNFYTVKFGHANTTHNIFAPADEAPVDEKWERAKRIILERHGGKPWQEFWGEEWE